MITIDNVFWFVGASVCGISLLFLLFELSLLGIAVIRAADFTLWRFRFGNKPKHNSGVRDGEPATRIEFFWWAIVEMFSEKITRYAVKDDAIPGTDAAWQWWGVFNWRDCQGNRVWSAP